MNAQQLKSSILQLAVQGKLVPQDSNDEPASVLLERIAKEREKLIKEKKIKKPKNTSHIFRRDGHFYESLNGGEPVCIDKQIPFDIPDSWEWVRLDNICSYIQRGKSPKYSPDRKYPVISQKCVQWSGFSIIKAQFIDPKTLDSYADERILQNCDLLWNSTGLGTIGRIAVYYSNLNPYELAVADSHVTVIRASAYISPEYLYYYFSNPSVQDIIEEQADGSTKQKELSLTTIKNYIVPIPPRQEQQRITKKIEVILPHVEEFGKHEDELSKLNKSFPDALKKSLLQWAIQGKLVPQDEKDEPASVLLERIAKERTAKLGKKAAKSMSRIERRGRETYYEIFSSGLEKDISIEIPFEIPDNWSYVRLKYILDIARGGSPRPIKSYLTNADNGVNWIKIGDAVKGDKYIRSTKEKIRPEGVSKSRLVHEGDFILSNSMSFGRPYIMKTSGCIHDGWLVLSDYEVCFNVDFLFYLLSSPIARVQFSESASGAVVQNLNIEKVENAIFPIPPIAEQERISHRLDDIFSYLPS